MARFQSLVYQRDSCRVVGCARVKGVESYQDKMREESKQLLDRRLESDFAGNYLHIDKDGRVSG